MSESDKENKPNISSSFHKTTNPYRRTLSSKLNLEEADDHVRISYVPEHHPILAHATYFSQAHFSFSTHEAGDTNDDDRNTLPQNRGYSIFQDPDAHTPEEKAHDEGFIKKQMAAAAGVGGVAYTGEKAGVFDMEEAILLGATGLGNVVRNKAWWEAVNNIPDNLGRIYTAPTMMQAKFLHASAKTLKLGIVETQKRQLKTWMRRYAEGQEQNNEIKRKAIENIAINQDGEIKAHHKALRMHFKMVGHYINNSPSYMLSGFARKIENSLIPNANATGVLNKPSRSMRRWMQKKARSMHTDSRIKRRAIEKYINNPIGRDIVVGRIGSVFLGLGVAVHIPQTKMGWDMYMQSGDLNGHLLGAGGVAIAYGLLAAHKLKEIPRLKELYREGSEVTRDMWDNRMRHEAIGHMARKEYAQQAIFVGLPLVGIIGKGLAYMYEATHIHHWDMETFTSIPDKIQNFDAKGALDYLATTDITTISNHLANADFTNTMSMTSSVLMLGAGYIFAKSGWDEAVEDFGRITKYGFRRYIKDPLNVAVDNARYSVDKYLENKPIQRGVWENAVRPIFKKLTPNWALQAPHKKEVNQEIRQKAARILAGFDSKRHITPDGFKNGEYDSGFSEDFEANIQDIDNEEEEELETAPPPEVN